MMQPLARVRVVADPERDRDDHQDNETWSLVDVDDGHVWLTFGTKNTNDYYP
jgi:hypothetical protein